MKLRLLAYYNGRPKLYRNATTDPAAAFAADVAAFFAAHPGWILRVMELPADFDAPPTGWAAA